MIQHKSKSMKTTEIVHSESLSKNQLKADAIHELVPLESFRKRIMDTQIR